MAKIVTIVLEVEGEFDMDPKAELYPPARTGDPDDPGESLPCAMLSLYAHGEHPGPSIKILSCDQKEAV
jgi:hypothetical protein